VTLCSIVADDVAGKTARQALQEDGMDTEHVVSAGSRASTAQYVAVNDTNKDLVLAMADMSILESADARTLQKWSDAMRHNKPSWVAVDANWNPSLLRFWLEGGKQVGAFTAYEPVSTAKSLRVFATTPAAGFPGIAPLPVYPNHLVDLACPNVLELRAMGEAARSSRLYERQEWWEVIDAFGIPSSGISHRLEKLTSRELVELGVPQQTVQLLPYMPTILTKLGAQGVLLTQLLRKNDARLTDPGASAHVVSRSPANSLVGGVYMRLFRPPLVLDPAQVVSVNGVGDTFLGAILSAVTRPGLPAAVEDAVEFAQTQAARTLRSREAVSPELKAGAL
jgi:pseudouridine-5'-phosphate glycosidase/pseudouridine kinase